MKSSSTCLLAMLIGASFHPRIHAEDIALEKLDISVITTGWGKVMTGKSAAGMPLAIGGEKFTNGIGVHAPSTANIQLDGKATRFRARVGVNDTGRNEPGSVEFLVRGDGKPLFSSGILHGGDKPVVVDVPLANVRNLQLIVTDGGDNYNSDHADWVDAVISYSGDQPKIIPPADPNAPFEPENLYPPAGKLKPSPGNTTWYINPKAGNDEDNGLSPDKAWKSIARINALKLGPGDKVKIAPGMHDATLKPSGAGTAEKPVIIEFLPGTHEFGSAHALRRPYFVSNSSDNPKRPLPIGIFIENSKHLRLQGAGLEGNHKTTILLSGPERMTYFINDRAEDITFSGLAFDLKRPTVSEFRVMDVADNSVVIQVEEASTYEIKDGKFAWTGDIGNGWIMVQQAIPAEGRAWRMGRWDPFSTAKASEQGGNKVRLDYAKGNFGMTKGHQFQFRPVNRDVVTAHNTRSKNITFRDCDFHAMTGMAIVSQFTDGITFERVRVAPEKGTLRTCPAWADMFHFSGCRGQILVNACVFSGCQDDPINVHGTHLRIIGKPSENQLLLRFMQPQTYGFAAFTPGDEVAVISHSTLRETPDNPRRKVTAVTPNPTDPTGHEWLITLDGPVPAFAANDVIDNISWYPDVTIKNCRVDMDSCRGFLLTTRGKVWVEGCTFHRCAMAGILIEDDAEGWFESGPINDMTLRDNKFIGCNIEINPASRSNSPDEPVHQNIRILDNFFDGAGISAKNTRGLTIRGNRSPKGTFPIRLQPSCSEITQENNSNTATE